MPTKTLIKTVIAADGTPLEVLLHTSGSRLKGYSVEVPMGEIKRLPLSANLLSGLKVPTDETVLEVYQSFLRTAEQWEKVLISLLPMPRQTDNPYLQVDRLLIIGERFGIAPYVLKEISDAHLRGNTSFEH